MEREMEEIPDAGFGIRDFVILMGCKTDVRLLITPVNNEEVYSVIERF
ncbi:hypothetical protein [Chryseobacterium jejuense]|nr:hypothetical protein [Chryseobacterium jejuense]MBP2615973.1 hypothetical protein [Chryseobacterium jejuense]